MIIDLRTALCELEDFFGLLTALRMIMLIVWPGMWAAWHVRALPMGGVEPIPAPWELLGRLVAGAAQILAGL